MTIESDDCCCSCGFLLRVLSLLAKFFFSDGKDDNVGELVVDVCIVPFLTACMTACLSILAGDIVVPDDLDAELA